MAVNPLQMEPSSLPSPTNDNSIPYHDDDDNLIDMDSSPPFNPPPATKAVHRPSENISY